MKISYSEIDMLLDAGEKAKAIGDNERYLSIHLSLYYFTTNKSLVDVYIHDLSFLPDLSFEIFRKMVDWVDEEYLSHTEIKNK